MKNKILKSAVVSLFLIVLQACNPSYVVYTDETSGIPYLVDQRFQFLRIIMSGILLCVVPLVIYFVISHIVRKQIKHPYKESIVVGALIWLSYTIWIFAGAQGESGLMAFPLSMLVFISSIISSLLIATIYKKIAKIRG